MSGLHVQRWHGRNGEASAVLVHMLTSSSATWWQLGPELAERGYDVWAPDLSGHGASPRRDGYTIDAMVDELVDAVPAEPDLLVAHSFGAIIAARAVARIRPARIVYAEPAWVAVGGSDRFAFYRSQKDWTIEDVRKESPRWRREAHSAKLAALADWDPATLQAIEGFPGYEPEAPVVPTLIVTADPSRIIPPERCDRFRAQGFEVRTVPQSAHVLHNEDFPGFLDTLKGWV